MKKNKKQLYQINLPVGNMPASKVKEYTKIFSRRFTKIFKRNGDFIIIPFRSDSVGERAEIIRLS